MEKVIKAKKAASPKDKWIITIYIDESSEDPTKKLTPEDIKKISEIKKRIEEEGTGIVNIVSVLKPE